jgi:UDP-glucose 4-epimerase
MTQKHVFITGIAGFLGGHLAERLLELGYTVSGNDTLFGGYRDNVPSGAVFFEIDCCDTAEMREILKGVDIVVHTAAAAHEGLSVFSPALITRDNMQASASTFSAAIANGVQRIVYCSSMARYGTNDVPFTEDMEPRPQDPYAISKVAGENLLKFLAGVHEFEYAVAIPHNIVGKRQKYDDPVRNVAAIMINLMLQGRQPFIYGDGEQKRSFSPVEDVVDCLVKLAVDPGMDGMVVNVGPDSGYITINELTTRIARLVGFEPLEPIYVPGRPCEVRYASCSSDLAREKLGFVDSGNLDASLLEIINWIRERGARPFDYHIELEILTDKTPETWKNRLM